MHKTKQGSETSKIQNYLPPRKLSALENIHKS